MIQSEDLDVAIEEAKRFIKKAEELKEVWATPPTTRNYRGFEYTRSKSSGVQHAACLRASMDLTRALAAIRKTNS